MLLKLAERAIDRIENAMEFVDDFDGECSALLERARDLHIRAACGARRDPVALARDLFHREIEGDHGTFDGAAWLYADVLSEAGLAEYRRLAIEAWEKLPQLTGRRRQEGQGDYDVLSRILDRFAEREGDIEMRIALRAKDLSSPWKYLQLAEFCLGQKGADEALRWAEEGVCGSSRTAIRTGVALFAAELLQKAGRRAEATADSRGRLQAHARLQCLPSLARDRRRHGLRPGARVARARAGERPAAFSSRPADLCVKILMHERHFETAWAMTGKYRVSQTIRRRPSARQRSGLPARSFGHLCATRR